MKRKKLPKRNQVDSEWTLFCNFLWNKFHKNQPNFSRRVCYFKIFKKDFRKELSASFFPEMSRDTNFVKSWNLTLNFFVSFADSCFYNKIYFLRLIKPLPFRARKLFFCNQFLANLKTENKSRYGKFTIPGGGRFGHNLGH
jgi:hypothetical protein